MFIRKKIYMNIKKKRLKELGNLKNVENIF